MKHTYEQLLTKADALRYKLSLLRNNEKNLISKKLDTEFLESEVKQLASEIAND